MAAAIIILAVAGAAALVLEVFVPGGVVGTAGALMLAISVFLVLTSDKLVLPFGLRAAAALVILAFAAVSFGLSMKWFPHTSAGRKLTLSTTIDGTDFYHRQDALVGRTGTVASPLRPAGKAIVDGRKIDVQSETGALDEGTEIRVSRIEGGIVYVRPA